MSTSNTWVKHWRSTIGKIAMAFAFASVISGIFLAPAFGQDHERHQGQRRPAPHERGWQARERHDTRHRRGREWRDARGRRVYQPYGYSTPLYLPPPPPPGISLFIPVPHIYIR